MHSKSALTRLIRREERLSTPVPTDFPCPIYQDLRSYFPFSLLCKRNDRTDKYCIDLRGLIDNVANHHWPLDSILISIFCAISRDFRGAGESKKIRAEAIVGVLVNNKLHAGTLSRRVPVNNKLHAGTLSQGCLCITNCTQVRYRCITNCTQVRYLWITSSIKLTYLWNYLFDFFYFLTKAA